MSSLGVGCGLARLGLDGNTGTDSNTETCADTCAKDSDADADADVDPGLLTFHEHGSRGHGAEEEGVVNQMVRNCGSANDRTIMIRPASLGCDGDGLPLRNEC
jgi:hypothetical protein